ncbi:hypothetical protein BGZ63DRAFT_344656 [Mariannaea sp. PMI_226]|nr:hypothetical protein BGZ63DRAFT_344656 [Mariannaea sp. PMI_226]
MGRGGRGGGQQATRRPVDLTGAISVAEKNDLSTLISAITDKMHNAISNIFDSPPVSPVQDEFNQQHWLSLSLKVPEPKEEQNHTSQPAFGSATLDPVGEQRSPEATEPQLQELRKEALVSFRRWQSAVLQRVRDIHVAEPGGSHAGCRGRGRGPTKPVPNHLDRELARRYPPIPTSLWTLPLEKRKTLLHISHLLLLSLQEYSSYTRLLLLYLTSSLNILLRFFQEEETRLAQGLSQVALKAFEEHVPEQKLDENKAPRRPKGKLLNPLTPGKLAPALVEIGIGTAHNGHGLIPGMAASLMGAMADNGLVSGPMFGIYVARPTSKMLESCSREIQDFGLVPVQDEIAPDYADAKKIPTEDRRLRIVVGINGWLVDENAIVRPWAFLGSHAEVFSLRWDMSILLSLGNALETVTKSAAWSMAKKEIASRTSKSLSVIVYSSLMEASWPAGLMKISKIVDNPWSLGMVRADKAGGVLADALMRSKMLGDRPVSLLGFGLGARAIYICLMALAERRQFGLVESVLLMGTPAPSESRVWLTLKSVVSGRLINVYSENDYLLGFLYRTSNIQSGVAGLQKIQGADGVENHDVSRLVSEHLRYSALTSKILKDIGWEDLNIAAIKTERMPRTGRR